MRLCALVLKSVPVLWMWGWLTLFYALFAFCCAACVDSAFWNC